DTNNDGDYNGPEDLKITSSNWDALGNFSVTLPNLLPGPYTFGVQAVDFAGNVFTTSFSFVYQGPSLSGWQAQGPGPSRPSGPGVQYPDVSGRITAIATDPRDASGNTYYIGSDNGGVWKTTDGGNDWTPLTEHLTDPLTGAPLPAPIGALAIGIRPPTAPLGPA